MGAWEVAEVIVRHSEAARDDCRKTAAEIRWAEAEEAVDQEDHAFDKAVEYMLSDGGRPWKKVPGKYRARLAGKRDEVVAEVERLRKEEGVTGVTVSPPPLVNL